MNPADLRYAKTHEWISVTDGVATMGISAFAVEALTDLVFIELPKVGATVEKEHSFCEIESVKAVSDVYAPVSGEVIEVNEPLADALERFSDDPYGEGWIAKIKMSDPSQAEQLMDFATYQKQCEEEAG
ncbi:Glycine cleavage system H protein [Posidoniimonas polymericola]|uniref:Glycine cleavage system H protein n=1 Tax=Posidoniimonas polymericola TaxID=2528002 RepID=A0A5C5YRX4_9BACT|nr:glycine cleavage system protein GcvH [Posidoniimonas polymericola]TWT77480.1 Glycine cleavage system H protein [Posidoniimonas polymericola]